MSPEQWKRALEILELVEAVEPQRRDQVIATECDGDRTLEEGLRELLTEKAAIGQGGGAGNSEFLQPLRPGEIVGPYQVLKLLGSGGMGEVFLALRMDDERLRVDAVKVLPADQMSRERLARAVRERVTLQSLQGKYFPEYRDHGTLLDGRPFLAMEFIDGLHVDEFCDHHNLSIAGRLQLFRRICDAISTAHQALVLHRDLKAANILVTPDGIPKILDFGIAKVLNQEGWTDRTLTIAAETHFSPNYASPEHIAEGTLTTVSDVYSLGVLLYKLLAGRVPVDFGAMALARSDLKSLVESTIPEPPSVVAMKGRRQRVDRDLDAIVMKALRKEMTTRYQSVVELRGEIDRFLDGRPVEARRGNRVYKVQKFLRRNWRKAMASAAVLVILLSQAMLAQQRRSAQGHYTRAEATAGFLTSLFENTDPLEQGAALSVEELLKIGQENLDSRLTAEESQGLRAELFVVLGKVNMNLGNLDTAEALLETGLDLQEQIFGAGSLVTSQTLDYLSNAQYLHGKPSQALLNQGRALAIRLEELGHDHADTASSLNNLGAIYLELQRFPAARQALESALAIKVRILERDDVRIAVNLNQLSLLSAQESQFESAVERSREALEIYRSALGSEHPRTARALNSLGNNLDLAGYYSEATEALREAIDIQERVLGPVHPDLALSLGNLGGLFMMNGRLEESRPLLERSLSIRQEVLGSDHPRLGASLGRLGLLYMKLGEYDLAAVFYEQSLETLLKKFTPTHRRVIATQLNLSSLLFRLERYQESEDVANEARRSLEEAGLSVSHEMSAALGHLAMLCRFTSRPKESEAFFVEAINLRRQVLGPTHPRLVTLLENFAELLEELGRSREAYGFLEEARRIKESQQTPDKS